jgi:hypothetical protein
MPIKEVKTEIWDKNGYVETKVEYIEVPEIDVNDQIQQKEEELLSMYQELERLKALRPE